MKETINKEVSVVSYYIARLKRTVPHILYWDGKTFYLGEVDYYHSYPQGNDKQHIFELADRDQTIWFRLRLDSSNLHWTLEAIHDGLPE